MPGKWFVLEWWGGVRPYALHLSMDLTVALLLLMSTWCFQQAAERFFPVAGIAHTLFEGIHQAGAIASFGAFASLSVRSIWRLSNGHGVRGGD